MMNIKCYSELSKIDGFLERYKYLRILGKVGQETFGFERYLNQIFYRSPEWRRVRNQVIVRDMGRDLGVPGHEIFDQIYIHHMNPITVSDIRNRSDFLFNPEFLICVSYNTHQAIHFGDELLLMDTPVKRLKNDTCPWKNAKGMKG